MIQQMQSHKIVGHVVGARCGHTFFFYRPASANSAGGGTGSILPERTHTVMSGQGHAAYGTALILSGSANGIQPTDATPPPGARP